MRDGSAVEGDRGFVWHVGLACTPPQFGFGGANPLERAAFDRGSHDEDLGAGLYNARFNAFGSARAAEVPAPERGIAGAEGVLGTRPSQACVVGVGRNGSQQLTF
jgi:hypothetical protein